MIIDTMRDSYTTFVSRRSGIKETPVPRAEPIAGRGVKSFVSVPNGTPSFGDFFIHSYICHSCIILS